ncbi:MAG: hypothetical protein AAF963_01895, partial [Bacteroidota bacterium]
ATFYTPTMSVHDNTTSKAELEKIAEEVMEKLKDQNILIIIGGSEANSVLGKEIIFRHFSQGYLDHRNYNLLYKTFGDLPEYIAVHLLLILRGIHVPLDDIASYIQVINTKHGYNAIRSEDIVWASSVFWLNPILYRSIESFYTYLFWGQTQSPIPHFSVGEARYMPLIRMGLTPFGLTYYLDNYVSYQARTFLASFQLGSSPFYTRPYGGLQLRTDRLWSYQDFYRLGVEAHIWHQPKLLMQPNDTVEDKNYWGGLLGLDNQFRVSEHFSLNATVLYKTPGFVEGVEAAGGLLWRAGLTLHY